MCAHEHEHAHAVRWRRPRLARRPRRPVLPRAARPAQQVPQARASWKPGGVWWYGGRGLDSLPTPSPAAGGCGCLPAPFRGRRLSPTTVAWPCRAPLPPPRHGAGTARVGPRAQQHQQTAVGCSCLSGGRGPPSGGRGDLTRSAAQYPPASSTAARCGGQRQPGSNS